MWGGGGRVTRVYFERDCCAAGDLEIIYTNIKKNTKLQTVTTGLIISQSSHLSVVRFEIMTADFLYDVVQYDDLANEMPDFEKFLKKGLAYHAFSQGRRNKLIVKPTQRPSYEDLSPTFSWIIDKNLRQKLSDCTVISSYAFWFQGYGMDLELSYDSTTDSTEYVLILFVLNTRKGGYLNISWRAESDLFNDSLSLEEMYTHEVCGWGDNVEPKIKPSDVSEAVSHTVAVWVEFV